MANVTEVSTGTFEQEVLKVDTPVLVDFWAPWCGPCRMVAPALEAISAEKQGQVKVVKVNVDDNQQLAVRYGVMTIPTIVLFKGGEPVDRTVGAASRDQLNNWINSKL